MDSGDKIFWIVVLLVRAAFVLFLGAMGDWWGSRGVDEVYTFQYQGQPAVVKHDDRIWALDNYWVSIGSTETAKILNGVFISDDGKRIQIGTDPKSESYSSQWEVKDRQVD